MFEKQIPRRSTWNSSFNPIILEQFGAGPSVTCGVLQINTGDQEKTREKSSLWRIVLGIVPLSTGKWICLRGWDARKKKDFPGSGGAGTQSSAGGMGVGQVWSRSRWKRFLRNVSSQGLQISKDGNPTAPSQLPSQSHCLKPNAKDLRK